MELTGRLQVQISLGEIIPADKRGKRSKRANILTLRSYFSDYHELCSCRVAILIDNSEYILYNI